MKYILILLSFFLFSFTTYADDAYNIWNTKIDKSMFTLTKTLKDINSIYHTNLDIVFLWIDKENCYQQTNYIKCSLENHWLMGAYIWEINVWKKLTKNQWDVNSFMSSSMDTYRTIINEKNMKNFQDNVLSYLKTWDYYNAWVAFTNEFEKYLKNKCSEIKSEWNKHSISVPNCYIETLSSKEKEINQVVNTILEKQRLENEKQAQIERIEREKQALLDSIEDEKQKELAAIKRKKQTQAEMIYLWYFSVLWIIVFVIYKIIFFLYLLSKVKKEIKDLSDLELYIKNSKNLLESDKKELLSQIKLLVFDTEILLGNRVRSKKEVLEIEEKIEKIKVKIKEQTLSESELKEVNSSIDEVKKIDL